MSMSINLESDKEFITIVIEDEYIPALAKAIHFLLKDNFIPSETTKTSKK